MESVQICGMLRECLVSKRSEKLIGQILSENSVHLNYALTDNSYLNFEFFRFN